MPAVIPTSEVALGAEAKSPPGVVHAVGVVADQNRSDQVASPGLACTPALVPLNVVDDDSVVPSPQVAVRRCSSMDRVPVSPCPPPPPPPPPATIPRVRVSCTPVIVEPAGTLPAMSN